MKKVGRIALYVLGGLAAFLSRPSSTMRPGSSARMATGASSFWPIAACTRPSRARRRNDTCTADRINPPTHDFIENTLPSMEAAFADGADVVELDVHLTPDKVFAVMHDWTVDCRTDGKGVTEQLSIVYLKSLDSALATLPMAARRSRCVARARPDADARGSPHPLSRRRFLINFKSRRAEEGEALARSSAAPSEWRNAIWASYGGAEPTEQQYRR